MSPRIKFIAQPGQHLHCLRSRHRGSFCGSVCSNSAAALHVAKNGRFDIARQAPSILAAVHISNHIDLSRIDWPKTVLLVLSLIAAAAITRITASLYYNGGRK